MKHIIFEKTKQKTLLLQYYQNGGGEIYRFEKYFKKLELENFLGAKMQTFYD